MDNMSKLYLDFKGRSIVGDTIGDTSDEMIFFLHGAGKSIRNRYETLRRLLYEKGFPSCAFDFIGHGETGGLLSESSLYERTEQACRVIEHIKSGKPISIVGSSMSGYTAVKLLELYDVKSLILLVPAAYDKDAYKLRFNDGFTDCIRKEKSYMNSDAWEIVNNYTGKFMIVSAENDTVIPGEVIDRYYESSAHAEVRKMITVKNSPHAILGYMEENTDVLKNIVDEMVEILV